MQTLEICGFNYLNCINDTSNNTNDYNDSVYPPINSKFNISSIFSYSMCHGRSIVVTNDGMVHKIGTLERKLEDTYSIKSLDHFTKIEIRDEDGCRYHTTSAIGIGAYTLYIVSKECDKHNIYLAYSHPYLNTSYPIILNTNGRIPVALFGGRLDCAAIDTEGAIIYIPESVCDSPKTPIEPIYLPNDEIATSIAWGKFFVIVLSSNGQVYISLNGSILSFNEVSELKGIEIICISGINDHCLAVSKDGKVFCRGYNNFGQLGLGKDIQKLTEFKEIQSLSKYKIVAAYAGIYHSLFQTEDGRILACGNNRAGELLMAPCDYNIYEPILTNVNNASFCIAGNCSTGIFKNYIPPFCPNKRINIDCISASFSKSSEKSPKKSTDNQINDLIEKQKDEYEQQLLLKDDELSKQKDEYERQLMLKNDELSKQKDEYERQLMLKDEELSKQKDEYERQLMLKDDELSKQKDEYERQLMLKDEELSKQKDEYERQLMLKDEELSKQKDEYERQLMLKDEELAKKIKEFELQICQKNKKNELLQKQLEEERIDFSMKLELKEKEIESIKLQHAQEINSLTKQRAETSEKIGDKSQAINSKKIEILDSNSIENLERLEKMSSGGFGKVYKVAKKEFYALKILKKSISYDDFRRFLAEYEIMNNLDHPNILKAYGIFLSNETQPPSILLEFCPTSLDELIKKKSMTNVEIVFNIYQIIESMKYIHSMKIIHRDLKPENIMIASDGKIKIGDFGISKLMTTEEQSKTYGIGTQKFMAPEIIDENNDYNEKVDVYSFGVLMFYMLNNGEMPVLKMSDKMTGKKAKIPSGFTDFSRDLINNCWNFQSKDRPSFAEMIDDMEKNNYSIVELSKSELNEIKLLIKQHKEKIPSYSA